uniref:Replication-associated protein n=1 Tax=Muscicapa latirostris Genomoviridae sp. TaxID=2814967 RepID=A0A8E7L5H0_9VIRU
MPSFSFHAKYALLTYSQCGDLDPEAIVLHFSDLGAECIVARENHRDGGTHLHVFVDFGRKRRFRSANQFDVEGHHPNICPSRGSPETGYDYAIKDGDVVGGGLERPNPERTGSNGPKNQTMDTLVRIDDEPAFWESVRELAPGLLLRSFPSLQSYAKWRFAPRIIEYRHPEGIEFSTGDVPELDEWREGNLQGSRIGRRRVRHLRRYAAEVCTSI